MRWLLLASVLAAVSGRAAHATTMTYSGTDPTDKLGITVTFSYPGSGPVTSFAGLSAFSLIVTALSGSVDPSASWSLSDIPTIQSESTNTYHETFNWTGSLDSGTQMESMGNDGAFNSYGFNLQGLSASSFTLAYGVGTGTEYTGNWSGVTSGFLTGAGAFLPDVAGVRHGCSGSCGTATPGVTVVTHQYSTS